MKALVVGLGSIGRRHVRNLRALRPEAELIAWRRPERDEQHDALVDRVVTSATAAASCAVDVAIVANPAPFHLDAARCLAEAGAHLLIEKPLADRLDGVDDVIALCAERGRALVVGYPFRFHAGLRALAGAIEAGRIGAVRSVRTEVGQYLPDWRPGVDYRETVSAQARLGGGALLELSHEIDTALWLMGQAVERVEATCAQAGDLEVDVETQAELLLRFAGGAVGSVHLDMLQRVPHRACRVVGSEGTLSWSQSDEQVRLVTRAGAETIHTPGEGERSAMYVEELRHFLACAEGTESPRVTGTDGRRVLEVVEAARRSHAEGAA